MIYVDRTLVVAPVILTQPGGDGLTERANAIANFMTGGPKAEFTYSVYRRTDVKEALILLFEGKCAYCESTFLNVYYGDVEHFRPKAEITEADDPKSPGYYWLASDWDNLLLSCKLCNSHKKHKVHGSTIVETLGKMNQFPLHNFQHVRDHLVGIAGEEPFRLLIDPCKEDPEELLSYGDDGNILPKKTMTGFRRLKSEKSIKVYALQRMDLVDERKKLRLAIGIQQQRVLSNTRNFLRFLDLDPGLAEEFEVAAKTEMQILKDFKDPQKPFAGMAREMINQFLIDEFDHIAAKVI